MRDECEACFSLLSSSDPRTSWASYRRLSATDSVLGVEQLGFERLALDVVTVALLTALLERHRELEDARALDLEHVEAHAVVVDRVTRLRLAPEQAEDEARHGVVILVGHHRL